MMGLLRLILGGVTLVTSTLVPLMTSLGLPCTSRITHLEPFHNYSSTWANWQGLDPTDFISALYRNGIASRMVMDSPQSILRIFAASCNRRTAATEALDKPVEEENVGYCYVQLENVRR